MSISINGDRGPYREAYRRVAIDVLNEMQGHARAGAEPGRAYGIVEQVSLRRAIFECIGRCGYNLTPCRQGVAESGSFRECDRIIDGPSFVSVIEAANGMPSNAHDPLALKAACGRLVDAISECLRLLEDAKPKGSIIVEQAYAAGKMLDHSSWRLSNGRSPSDIDMVLDKAGRVLFVEIIRAWWEQGWDDISVGQRWLYKSLSRLSPNAACVLARHDIPELDQVIDTLSDIKDAEVMFAQATKRVRLSGDEYRSLVEQWDRDAAAAIAWLDTLAEQRKGGAS